MIINIWGPSGSGKTTLIRDAIQGGVVSKWVQALTNNANDYSKMHRVALSMAPMPKFRGSVESYLKLFGISHKDTLVAGVEILELYDTIFHVSNNSAHYKDFERKVETLSAGEGRRLSVLRCLLEKADIRIIDEPFSNSHHHLNEIIIRAIKVRGSGILLTHDEISQQISSSNEITIATVEEARKFLYMVSDDP